MGVLNTKLSLLEPANLDQVDVRLASVLQTLNKIAEKKSGQADLERQNKVQDRPFIIMLLNGNFDD